jgi:hypothetical protein
LHGASAGAFHGHNAVLSSTYREVHDATSQEADMCYEERYYSEWTRRTARKREEPAPAVEPRKTEVAPGQDQKPVQTPVEEQETASVE